MSKYQDGASAQGLASPFRRPSQLYFPVGREWKVQWSISYTRMCRNNVRPAIAVSWFFAFFVLLLHSCVHGAACWFT